MFEMSRNKDSSCKSACHRCIQISSHGLCIKKWAHTQMFHHTQSQIRSERASSQAQGNATLIHINTHTSSHRHTGLALFWHAALRWPLWGFRGIERCWLCCEPAEPLHSHSCLPHHLQRASNHCGKSGLGRAEDISLLSSSSIPLLPSLRLSLYCTLQLWEGVLLPLVQGGCHNSLFFEFI